MQKKILISDIVHPILEQMLLETDFSVDIKPDISYNDLVLIAHNYTGLVVRSRFKVNQELIEAGDITGACEQLDSAYALSDNLPKPSPKDLIK